MDIDLSIKAKNKVDDVARAVARSPDNLVESALSELVGDIRRSMEAPGQGRLYGSHRASAPGQPPAIDTTHLHGSISKERTGPTSGRVYTRVEYARYLEYGTHKRGAQRRNRAGQFVGGFNDAGMKPRPFFRPAARRMRAKWAIMSRKELAVIIHRAAT